MSETEPVPPGPLLPPPASIIGPSVLPVTKWSLLFEDLIEDIEADLVRLRRKAEGEGRAADFDALVNEADTTVDPARLAKLYAQAQTLLTDDAPAAFGWTSQNSYLIKPWVKGIVTTPLDFGFAGMQAPLSIDIDPSMLPQ